VPRTNPNDFNSDDDGLSDGAEVLRMAGGVAAPTNPMVADTDGDQLLDGDEQNTHFTDPLRDDSDGDGLNDRSEIIGNTALRIVVNGVGTGIGVPPTLPLDNDTDNDGIQDGAEVNRQVSGSPSPTNPTAVDTDGDTIADNTDTYPLNQPTVTLTCATNPCVVTEPTTNTPATTLTFTLSLAYQNPGQNVTVNYSTVTVGQINQAVPPAACSTGAEYDYVGITGGSHTFASETPTTAAVQICADKRGITGGQREPSTESFRFSLALPGGSPASIANSPAYIEATLNNR
jgi:hypothetical protein